MVQQATQTYIHQVDLIQYFFGLQAVSLLKQTDISTHLRKATKQFYIPVHF